MHVVLRCIAKEAVFEPKLGGGFVQRTAFLAMKKMMKAEWGDQPCTHPRIIEEHFLSVTTGAFACTVCGRDITFDEKRNPIAN